MQNLSKGKIIAIIGAVIVIAVGGITYFSYQKNIKKMKDVVEVDQIYNGITIENINVGGLNKERAKALLERELQDKLNTKTITLKTDKQVMEVPYSDLGAKFDIEKSVIEAYEIGREGSLKERYNEIIALAQSNHNIEVTYSYDSNKIDEKVKEFEQMVLVAPINSEMSRKNGQFIITDEQPGYELNVLDTTEKIKDMVAKAESGVIEADMNEVPPTITKEQNQQATTLIGSFYTNFSSGVAGRNENLRVGCLNINGTVLQPGDVFSMNKELGPQTYANGYRNAAVIVNGKIEDGLAGGVCQITTTLYNAVIFAELDVVERRNHSLSVAYVPLGRDAAVAGDYTDFKFKNSTAYPVYVEAYLENNKLITNIYGHEEHSPGREVEFEKVFLETIQKPAEKVTEDPNKPEGEREVTYKGKTGSKVSTYKKVFQDGNLVSREWFSNSTYKATPDEVTVGTKKQETAPASITQNAQPKQEKPTENKPTEVQEGNNIQIDSNVVQPNDIAPEVDDSPIGS